MREDIVDISFVTIADEKFRGPLLQSLKQNQSLYPNAYTYVYDWGLSVDTRQEVERYRNVTVLNWNLLFVPITIHYGWRFAFIKSLSIARDATKQLFGAAKTNHAIDNFVSAQDFEIKIYNKFLCLEHFLHEYKKPFVFLDADAFLVNKVDEVFTDDAADVFLTIRRGVEISYTFNNCSVLNVGVMFFLGTQEKRESLFRLWREELDVTHERYCEQTSLTRLLAKTEPDLYSKVNDTVVLPEDVRVKLLPCENYNFNWVEEITKIDDSIKVLHFKSGRYTTELFSKMTL